MSLALQSDPHLSQRFSLLSWRSFFCATAAATLFTLIPGYFWGRYCELERRYQAWLQLERTSAALNKSMSLQLEPGRQYEVGQLLQELSREAGVRIALDRLDIDKGILKINQKVTFDDWQTHNQPLGVILREVAHSLERPHPTDPFDKIPRVVITQERGRIVLTSRSFPFEPLRVRVYTLPVAMPEGAVLTSTELSDDIQLSVDIDSWDDVGGPGSIGALPATVVVSQTQSRHKRIAQVVERLTSLPSVSLSLTPIPLFPIDTAGEQRILEALDRSDSFDFQQVPLNEVVDQIHQRFSFPITLATKKLEEAAIDRKMPVTLRIRNVSLGSCLRHLLGDLGLTYVIKDGFMQITTPEDACSQLYPVLYPVHDLLPGHNKGELEDVDSFFQSVDRDSWDSVGGPASLVRISHGWFLIWQTPDVHQHLEERLGLLRAKIRPPHWPPVRLTPRQLAQERILTRLEQDYRGNFAGLTFAEYFAKIQEDFGMPVLVSGRALDERVSADYQPPIDSNIQPLWRQLDAALEPSDLEFEVRDEAIVITYDSSAHLYCEVFDVQDLTASNRALFSQHELCDLLIAAIESDDWTFSAIHGHLAVEGSLQNILEARSLIAYLKDNREHLPQVVDVRSMAKESVGYQRLLDETENNNDRWRKAYLEFAITRPAVPSRH